MEQVSGTATQTAVQYGVLGVVALAFAFAIIQLFKTMRADTKSMEEERKQWAIEKASMHAEYERKHRELVEHYADEGRQERENCMQIVRDERDANREHEDLVRREFADLMEKVAIESGKASQAIVDMMQKFYDRFVGPTRGR